MKNGLAKCKDSRNVQVTSCKGRDKSDGRCRWRRQWLYATAIAEREECFVWKFHGRRKWEAGR